MGGKKGRFLSLPVLAVISLIGFVYYTTVFVFIEDWLGLSTSLGFLNYLIYSWVAFMSLLSFFVAVIKDPGGVPTSCALDSENPPKNQGVTSRYCDKCSTYKPPRSHHCRVCKRCVLKMDHHCVWISNCVGYGNYKPFIIFVLHAATGSIYSTVIFVSSILQKEHDFSGTSHKLFYVLCGFVMIGLSLTIGTLLVWHIYLLTHNMTTIEYREAVRVMWLARKSGQKYRHRFDLGVYKNLSQFRYVMDSVGNKSDRCLDSFSQCWAIFGCLSCQISRMANWCRKCIYLKPKLEKLAADYYPRIRFYRVDVNAVPQRLVIRAEIARMPTIQLWKDSKKQAEVIGGHKAWLVVDDVRKMIENED